LRVTQVVPSPVTWDIPGHARPALGSKAAVRIPAER